MIAEMTDVLPIDDEELRRKQIARYREFIHAQLERRPLTGSLLELPRILLWSFFHGMKVFKGFRMFGRERDRWRTFLRNAVPVMAYPLMVNLMLRRPGIEPSAGLVLITFDPSVTTNQAIDVVGRIDAACSSGSTGLPDVIFCRKLMNHEDFILARRRKIPMSLTDGREFYACDLWIPPKLLHRQCISDDLPFIPCMAEPGESGRINVMPWWIGIDVPEPAIELDASKMLHLGAVFYPSDVFGTPGGL
jgi:hypothetical protein